MNHALIPLGDSPVGLFRNLRVEPEEAKSILRHQKDARYGWGFSLNPYRGCSHGCRFCYVRGYPAPLASHQIEEVQVDEMASNKEQGQLGPPSLQGLPHAKRLHDPLEWGRWVTPKLNAPELLWAQRHKLHNESVFISSATDPYQPIEREFRLTRKCLQVLLACPTTEVIIHTRSPLVLQDLGILKAFGGRLSVGFSIPTDDDAVRHVVEPDAPSIQSRWAAVEMLSRAGIRVGVSATPLMTVRDIAAFARQVRDSGAKSAWVGGLRLLRDDPFYALLAEHRWLHVLDSDYREQVRQAFKAALHGRPKPFPARSSSKAGKPRPGTGMNAFRLIPEPVWASGSARPQMSNHSRFNPGQQPSLFTQAS